MAIAKSDVLAVLADPLLNWMKFSVDGMTVSAEEYRNVADYIRDDDIQVISGKQTSNALYDRETNTLEVQQANSPLPLDQRAQILHECTHAISDINAFNPYVLTDEVAAYLAQFAYFKMSMPTPFPDLVIPPNIQPLQALILEMLVIVKKYNLNTPRGFGARIDWADIDHLRPIVGRVKDYSGVKLTHQTKFAGVPSSNWIRAIKILVKHRR
jgi:hypothetical protein